MIYSAGLMPVSRLSPRLGGFHLTGRSYALADLVADIAAHGILVPLAVDDRRGVLLILAGFHRFAAAKLLRLSTVPVIVKSHRVLPGFVKVAEAGWERSLGASVWTGKTTWTGVR